MVVHPLTALRKTNMNTAQKLLYAIGGNAAIIASGMPKATKKEEEKKKERKVSYGESLRAYFAAKNIKS